MQTNDSIGTVAFSHRPQDGISIGLVVVAGVAYLAGSFVREGDHFSRRLARRIITQRLISTLESGKYVTWTAATTNFPENLDTRDIIREFRKIFKPDPTCNDGAFSSTSKLGEVAVRSPMSRKEAWDKIAKLFTTATVNASNAKCVS